MPPLSRKARSRSKSASRAPKKLPTEYNDTSPPPTSSKPDNDRTITTERPEIVPRSYRFHLPKDRILDWDQNGKLSTCFINTMSVFFPVGEQFFIDSVKRHQEYVPKGSKLYEEVRKFTKQESTHSREHELYNEALRPHAPVQTMEYIIETVLYLVSFLPRSLTLGGTIALEHLTATLGHSVLMDLSQIEKSEPHFKALWIWHSVEEVEHKGVAYDVYVAAYGYGPLSYACRMFTFVLALTIFIILLVPFFLWMAFKTGLLFDFKGWKNLSHHHWNKENGIFRRVTPQVLDYVRPDFHPWQLDDSHLLQPLSEPPK